ncbi:HNH endonuclease signature motif containing protein [Gordonia insulae]|uniref:HNH nuclease domain-containing protein n=1 Tax=Gordonia insulae TaxID=2420509 RepID=A0A3G8JM50_9ACTN|nr:HNH endonuclease signature motif containing protein [Gordonia insulae]AZG45685.1 hypothetical protein D7316_02285 [Gordonia insulae]
MTTVSDLPTLTDTLRDLTIDDDLSGRDAFNAMRTILTLRNLIDHHAAHLVATLDRLGVATTHGRKTRELLIVMGYAPAVAARLIRIAGSTTTLPTLHAHAADGAIPAEHIDAITTGITHIAQRSPQPVDSEARYTQVSDLLGHYFSGATPAQIAHRAKQLGNDLAATTAGGLPAGEDRTLNTLTHHEDHGRLHIRADLDTEVGEKFQAALEHFGAPRPEPDGSPDARSTARRHADALETVLDLAARGDTTTSTPRPQVLITVPAERPTTATLQFMGSLTETTLQQLSCDATVTTVIIDDQQVPLQLSKNDRFFTGHLRTALYIRDECCIKCGAPAARSHGHHIQHWAHNGATVLDNGCLLCPSCHADIHHNGWDVIIGTDNHPWLIPPTEVDPQRTPLPAYNRRTLTLDNLPTAA